jgi:thiamine-monophosphate kinase
MNTQTAGAVAAAGADGIAVVSAICAAENPRGAAEELVGIIGQHRPARTDEHAQVPRQAMTLKALGEFGWIERMVGRLPNPTEEVIGIGDDCAVLPWTDNTFLLVSTDMLLENTHFLRARISPEQLGYKALAVALSDIASMGGTPLAAFLSIGLPPSMEVAWMDRFFDGIRELGIQTHCPLLGGDTTRSSGEIVIDFSVLGKVRRNQIKYRSTAQPGDVIAVTGTLGDSGAGLRLLLGGHSLDDQDGRELIERHCRPIPHLREGQWLARHEAVHAMMDVSDGIDSDLRHIMKRSVVGVYVDLETLPISDATRRVCRARGWSAEELAVSAGEDYCLLCTVDPETFPALAGAFEATLGRALWPIGKICEGTELVYRREGQPATMQRHGFDHFKSL